MEPELQFQDLPVVPLALPRDSSEAAPAPVVAVEEETPEPGRMSDMETPPPEAAVVVAPAPIKELTPQKGLSEETPCEESPDSELEV